MAEPYHTSDFCQGTHAANLSMKGGYKARGKGKGFKGRYPVRPSNLSIEDRRKKLQELKAKTECKDCGKKGHWRGDRQCTLNNKTAHVATLVPPPPQPIYPRVSTKKRTDSEETFVDTMSSHAGNAASMIDSDDEERDDDEHDCSMAVKLPKPVTPTKKREEHDLNQSEERPMEWTFPEYQATPPGGDSVFTTGALRGQSFIDVTLKHPEQYIACRRSKKLTAEMRTYCNWVKNIS